MCDFITLLSFSYCFVVILNNCSDNYYSILTNLAPRTCLEVCPLHENNEFFKIFM